jgi:hypothetical protein
MKTHWLTRLTVLTGCAAAGIAQAAMTTIPAAMDTTIFQNPDAETRPLSNGQGSHFFAGVTGINHGYEVRRGLVSFDVAGALPEGAVVEEAVLRVTVSLAPPAGGADAFSLHRALAPWGEGSSDAPDPEGQGTTAAAGDATWLDRLYPDTPWQTPGGEFAASPSAVTFLEGPDTYFFAGAGLTADVQMWLDAPHANFGWFLLGDETGAQNARRFDSRDHADPTLAPSLLVTYSIIPEPSSLGLVLLALTLTLPALRRTQTAQ